MKKILRRFFVFDILHFFTLVSAEVIDTISAKLSNVIYFCINGKERATMFVFARKLIKVKWSLSFSLTHAGCTRELFVKRAFILRYDMKMMVVCFFVCRWDNFISKIKILLQRVISLCNHHWSFFSFFLTHSLIFLAFLLSFTKKQVLIFFRYKNEFNFFFGDAQ